MTVIVQLLSRFPLWLLHGLGWLLGWTAFLLSASYRRVYVANARHAGFTLRQVQQGIGHAGKMVMEIPRLWLGAQVRVAWDGDALVAEALQEKRGVLFLTPHLGCFEVTAQAYAARFGVHGAPMTVLYRPARKSWLQELVATARRRPGMDVAPASLAGVKQLIRQLKAGACVGLLPDQVPPKGMGAWAPFFGKDAYTMTLPVRLVAQTGAVVLLAWGERLPWGRGYVVHVRRMAEPLSGDLQQGVRQLNAAMQTIVREAPAQYLWGYARYKEPRDGL